MRARLLALLLVAVVVVGGCAQATTHFLTNPVGAKIYVNGKLVGETPCAFTYDRVPGRRYRIQILKEGYRAYEFFLDPLLSNALEEQYEFRLEPESPAK